MSDNLLSASVLCLILMTRPSSVSTFVVTMTCVLAMRMTSFHLTF